MTKNEAINLLNIYGNAWMKQDSDLILTIFTSDVVYNDPNEPVNFGHKGLKDYWVSKVIGEQREINFKLLNTWVDGDTVIAEWEADFIDTKRNMKINMTEVAIFTVQDNKFSSLREYYKDIQIPLI